MLLLTKSLFIAGMTCPLGLWYRCHQPDLIPSISPVDQSRIDAGIEVGKIACQLFPNGKRVVTEETSREESVTNTQRLIKDESVPAIFEGSFLSDGVSVRADILQRTGEGRWKLKEVKSSTKVKEEHLYDVWIQYHVLTELGIDLDEAGILYLNRDYLHDGRKLDLEGLFTFADLLSEVRESGPELFGKLQEFKEIIANDTPPQVELSKDCKKCEFCDHCTADKPKHWIRHLPAISDKKWNQLTELGIEDIRNIPEDFKLTPTQAIVRDCTVKDQEFISPELPGVLSSLKYPICFLDFESFYPAIPRYAATRPYQQVVFQWSCHILGKDGKLEHKEFLHDKDSDPRPPFTESLLRSVGEKGSIVHYWVFEKTRIKELARDFPKYGETLLALLERLKDLCQVIKKHYYHPDFVGSYSIKKVLPVLVPELSYADLDVQEGEMASLEYLRMIDSGTSKEEKTRIRQSLLKYCERDSLAMVRIYEVLKEKAK